MRAVEEAYKNQVMVGKFPVSVLNIGINPAMIDINVHPTKLEVKFSDENEIYRAVYNAVKEALYRIADIPEISREVKKEKPFQTFERDTVSVVKEQIEIKNDIVVEKVIPPSIDKTKTEPIPKVSAPQFFERTFEKKEEPPKIYKHVIEEVKGVIEKTVIKEESQCLQYLKEIISSEPRTLTAAAD